MLKDDALIDIATHAPRSAEALGQLRSVPNGFERSRIAAEVLAAVERGLALDPKAVPLPARERPRGGNGAVLDLLKVLLKAVSDKERVAPKIIATVDDLEAIAADDEAAVASLHGWRREIFGELALRLKHGKLALLVERGRVRAMPRDLRKAFPSVHASTAGSRPTRRASCFSRFITARWPAAPDLPAGSAPAWPTARGSTRGNTPMAADSR